MRMKSKYIVLLSIVALLVVIRAVAPSIILKKTNEFLATFSETYYAHIGDFDLSLIRGAYRFEDVIIALQENKDKPFAQASGVDVSISWSQLFRGRILTDVVTTELNLIADQAVSKKVKSKTKASVDDAKEAKDTLFPVQVERIEIRNSRVEYKEYNIFADQIEGRLSNVTSTEENPLSLLTLRGLLLGKTPLKAVSTINLTADPLAWVVAVEVQKLNLVDTNFLTSKMVPLTFNTGVLDVYSEIKSEDGRISGYVKPFLKDGDLMGDSGDFKGIKHFGIELSTAALNLFFKSNEKKTVATKVLFTYENGKFEWNQNEAFTNLFKNGYQQELNPGLENLLSLSRTSRNEGKKQ